MQKADQNRNTEPCPPLQDVGFCDESARPDKIPLHGDPQAPGTGQPYPSPLMNFRFFELKTLHTVYVEREN